MQFLIRNFVNIFPQTSLLINILQWRQSWISDRHKNIYFSQIIQVTFHASQVCFHIVHWFQSRWFVLNFSHRIVCWNYFGSHLESPTHIQKHTFCIWINIQLSLMHSVDSIKIIRSLFGSVNGRSMNRYYGTLKSSTIWLPNRK